MRFTLFYGVNSSDSKSAFSRFVYPLFVWIFWGAIWGVIYAGCLFLGRIYDTMLYDNPQDREPKLWPYEGWVLSVTFLAACAWLDLVVAFLRKRCLTQLLVGV